MKGYPPKDYLNLLKDLFPNEVLFHSVAGFRKIEFN